MVQDPNRTASLMTPARLAQIQANEAEAPEAGLAQPEVDTGSIQLTQLLRLQGLISVQAGARDYAPLSVQLEKLADTLPQLDLALVQISGWWARTTGKSKKAADQLTDQCAQIAQCNQCVLEEIDALQKKMRGEASKTGRLLMELEMEHQALKGLIEKSLRWLGAQQIRLKELHAADSRQQLSDEAAHCESLVLRMESLQTISTSTQQTLALIRTAASQRSALLQLCQHALVTDMTNWQKRVPALPTAMLKSAGSALAVEGPIQTHHALHQRVTEACLACAVLHKDEQAQADSLATLAQQLLAAGATPES